MKCTLCQKETKWLSGSGGLCQDCYEITKWRTK